MKPIRVYPSAFDTWLMIVMYGPPVGMLAASVWFVAVGQDAEGVILGLMGLALLLFNLLLTRPCRYTLTADTLNIRCGLMNETIPLERIRSAEKSSSILSAPALSLRRVCIRLDKGQRLVSPVNRDQFIEDVMESIPIGNGERVPWDLTLSEKE